MTWRKAGVVLVFLGLMAAPPAAAQSDPGTEPRDLLEEGTEKILRAFELFILAIPQYEAPEVLPNGDIIIRRKNPPDGGFQERGPADPPPPPPPARRPEDNQPQNL